MKSHGIISGLRISILAVVLGFLDKPDLVGDGVLAFLLKVSETALWNAFVGDWDLVDLDTLSDLDFADDCPVDRELVDFEVIPDPV